jgi:hypothetical protein
MALGINNRGEIVGFYDTTCGGPPQPAPDHAFLGQPDGTIVELPHPGTDSGSAVGINDRGTVVGGYSASSVPHQSFGFILDAPLRRASSEHT